MERKVLLTPGPATTSEGVKNAQVVPDICPREKEFCELVKNISKDILKISGAGEDYECIIMGGSGSAGMDCVLNSVVNGRVLIINNGAYGKRFVEIAKRYSMDYKEVFFDWNEEIDVERIKDELERDIDIRYIAMIHHETTTGILNPIKEAGRIAKSHGCVFIVDAISSFAGMPLDVKECCIDFMISTSNKCLQGMPGLFFVICRKEELNKISGVGRAYYLNLYEEYKHLKDKNQSRFTPPVQTVYALKKAIDEFFEEELENRHRRYVENWETLVEGMKQLGFKMAIENLPQSHLITTFLDPLEENYNFDKMHDLLFEKGFTIYPGKIKEKTFRLANIGDISKKDILDFLTAMEETLKEMGLNFFKND